MEVTVGQTVCPLLVLLVLLLLLSVLVQTD